MDPELQQAFDRLQESLSVPNNLSALATGVHLLIAGAIGLYLRALFRRCTATPSDSDGITRVFPLLTVITCGVIAVVKSSLALSLGLVGALSIVRFRSAIKEPEELVYLFLCVAVGLALGAELPILAILLVIVATALAVIVQIQGRRGRDHNLLLTITGDSHSEFGADDPNVLSTVEAIAGKYTLQRFDLENGRGQVRLVLNRTTPRDTADVIARLKEKLPDCEFSYVNLNSSL